MIDETAINGIAKSVPFRVEKSDYQKDGLWVCGKCNTPKQCRIDVGGKVMTVPCLCNCQNGAWEKSVAERRANEERLKIQELRAAGLADKTIRGWTFETADGRNAKIIRTAEKYCFRFEDVYKANTGLLLWGDTGNGKTFTAACIANRLIDRGIPVLMTSFPRILSALTGMRGEDRFQYIESMNRFKLLIIDDLGAERATEFATEQVYSVIDTRYKSGKPLIISSNLPLKDMKSETDMNLKRIYDRILEMCVPIQYKAESFRREKAQQKKELIKEILGG